MQTVLGIILLKYLKLFKRYTFIQDNSLMDYQFIHHEQKMEFFAIYAPTNVNWDWMNWVTADLGEISKEKYKVQQRLVQNYMHIMTLTLLTVVHLGSVLLQQVLVIQIIHLFKMEKKIR